MSFGTRTWHELTHQTPQEENLTPKLKYPGRTIQILGNGQQLSLNMKVFRTSSQQNLPEELLILMHSPGNKIRIYIVISSPILLGPTCNRYLLTLALLKKEKPAKMQQYELQCTLYT